MSVTQVCVTQVCVSPHGSSRMSLPYGVPATGAAEARTARFESPRRALCSRIFRSRASQAMMRVVNFDEALGTAVAFLGFLLLATALGVLIIYGEARGALVVSIPGSLLAGSGLFYSKRFHT